MSRVRWMLPIFLAVLLLLPPVTACAQEVPDAGRSGSITVRMESNGKAVVGGVLTAYRVGQVQEGDGDYQFVAVSGVEGFTLRFTSEDLRSPERITALVAYVEEKALPACATAGNENGKAVFQPMQTGLYLIVQTQASTGYQPISPFLISLPMQVGGTYEYEVAAEGKFELETKPTDSTLPQTGQTYWPVPILAGLGLCLLAAGCFLRGSQRREDHET